MTSLKQLAQKAYDNQRKDKKPPLEVLTDIAQEAFDTFFMRDTKGIIEAQGGMQYFEDRRTAFHETAPFDGIGVDYDDTYWIVARIYPKGSEDKVEGAINVQGHYVNMILLRKSDYRGVFVPYLAEIERRSETTYFKWHSEVFFIP